MRSFIKMLLSRSSIICLFYSFLVVPDLLSAQVPQRDEADSISVSITDIHGKKYSGFFRSLSANGIRIENSVEMAFKPSEILRVHFPGRRPTEAHSGSLIVLENGDRLFARPEKITEDLLIATWHIFPKTSEIKLPLETVRGMFLNLALTQALRDRAYDTLTENRKKSDIVLLKNGNSLPGELTDFDLKSLAIEGAVGKMTVARTDVRALVFNTELVSFPKFTDRTFLVTLADGSRITVKEIQSRSEKIVTVKPLYGGNLALPLSQIVSLRFYGERVTSLSDLKPIKYKFTPFLSAQWNFVRNRNVAGSPLRLRGITYPKGIGLHSKSRITYDLNRQYDSFQSVIGIDDSANGRGNVVFAVDLDGERVFTSPELTGSSPALVLDPINLQGKKRMSLIVDFGSRGDILDHADWCDPVLIK